MKKYIISLFMLIGFITVYAGTAPEVINFPGLTKRQIFDKSLVWISTVYRSSDAVIDHKDLGTGTIITKGYFSACGLHGVSGEKIGVTMTIEIKDGKARISATPFEIRTKFGTTASFTTSLGYGDCFDEHITKTKQSYKDFVNKKAEAW